MSDYRSKAERSAAERFPRDTAKHEMTILHDDGLYRHLRFAQPKPHSWSYWFDIVTWPGSLTIRGDIGESYTFSRLPDMFEFFRSRSGGIDPHYWAEKLDGGRRSVQEYDEDTFKDRVKEHAAEAIRAGSAPRGIGKAVREEILDSEYLADENEARKLLDAFEFKVGYRAKCSCGATEDVASDADGILWGLRHKWASDGRHEVVTRRSEGFTFYDTWEWSFSDYSWGFLWACHAIVWGIGRYDAAKTLASAEAVAS